MKFTLVEWTKAKAPVDTTIYELKVMFFKLRLVTDRDVRRIFWVFLHFPLFFVSWNFRLGWSIRLTGRFFD